MPPTNEPPAPAPPPTPEPPAAPAPPPPPQPSGLGFIQKLASPKAGLLLFALMFAGVGGYILFRSFAASLSNEGALLSAFQKMNKDKPSQVQTTANITYSGGTTFKSTSLTSTTGIDKYNNSSTKGSLSVVRAATSTTKVTPYVFPFEARTLYNYPLFKISNTKNLKNALPTGSGLRNWLQSHESSISRLENNWYSAYNEGVDADKAPNADNLGCLLNTPLFPSYDNLSAMANSYGKTPPLSVAKTIAGNQTVYTITPRSNTKDLNSYLNGLANLDYFKKINACTQLTVHAKATDKLIGSSANYLAVTVTVDSQKRITKITFTNAPPSSSSRPTPPKAATTISSTFTYNKPPAEIQWPDTNGDFNAYYRYLNDPTKGVNNALFSYTLPTGWGADYCSYYGNEYASVWLYPDGLPTGPYCGYSDNSRAYIASDRYEYNTDDYIIIDDTPVPARTPGAKKDKALSTFRNKSPQADARDKAKVRSRKPATSPPLCTADKETSKTVTIDGKNMTRFETIYGNCNVDYGIATGTKAVYYDYFQDDPSSPTTGIYSSFFASYWQTPKNSDKTAAFDSLVETVNLKW